jgi:hypothetical protein
MQSGGAQHAQCVAICLHDTLHFGFDRGLEVLVECRRGSALECTRTNAKNHEKPGAGGSECTGAHLFLRLNDLCGARVVAIANGQPT